METYLANNADSDSDPDNGLPLSPQPQVSSGATGGQPTPAPLPDSCFWVVACLAYKLESGRLLQQGELSHTVTWYHWRDER